jgi:hypothetical protein
MPRIVESDVVVVSGIELLDEVVVSIRGSSPKMMDESA